MNEPWDIKPESNRPENTLYTFVLFCEDEVSEKLYFKCFENDKVKINVIPKQDSKVKNVIKASQYKEEKQFDKGLEIWSVFDRDVSSDTDIRGDIEFDMSIEGAEPRGVGVAWSNDAFELWILLHMEDVDPTNEDAKSRDYYYQRLKDIFMNLPAPCEQLENARIHPSFGYKNSLKRERNFKAIVLPHIMPKMGDAIERARNLVNYHTGEVKCCDKAPCTLVHTLVERILEKGGGNIKN